MVHAISSFMEFFYLVSILSAVASSLRTTFLLLIMLSPNFTLNAAFLTMFILMGIHYPVNTHLFITHSLFKKFGAPNGLCSSITKLKHIKAVKEPWQRSSHYEALVQMLVTNQHLDKLAAARVDFQACGMLDQ